MSLKYVQANILYQSGSGNIIGDTSINLTNLTDIYGNVLTMSHFGSKGYGTLEPDTINEESFTFTGITANANGTYTLTGVATTLAVFPYTETSGLIRAHAGGTKVVISDTTAFWNTFANLENDETVLGNWTFNTAPVALSATRASASVLGNVKLTSAPLTNLGTATVTIASPAVVTLASHGLIAGDSVQFTTTGVLPTGITASTDYYVISTGLTTNTFEISTTIGGTAVDTSGSQSGTHTLYRTTPFAVGNEDTRLPTTTQAQFIAATTGMISMYGGSSAPTGFLLCDGSAVSRTTYASLFSVLSTSYGTGDGSTTFNVPDLRSRVPVGIGTGTLVATFASRASNVITVTGLTNTANNGFQTGQAVTYHTSGTVITGLTNDTVYYLVRVSNTTFSLATTLANAQNGTVISLSGDGTGTQTFTSTLTARTIGDKGGEENHAMSSTELLAHNHGLPVGIGGSTGAPQILTNTTPNYSREYTTDFTANVGGNAAMNNMQPFVTVNYIIKT